MKPESFLQMYQHHDALRRHRAGLEELREQDPGAPPGSEQLSPTERYRRIADFLKTSLAQDEDAPKGPKDGAWTSSTPALPIRVGSAEEERTFFLRFDYSEANVSPVLIRAVWGESPISDTPQGGANRELSVGEEVQFSDIADNQSNPFLISNLNKLEWSFIEFQKAAQNLTPAQAKDFGFSEQFTENLPASEE